MTETAKYPPRIPRINSFLDSFNMIKNPLKIFDEYIAAHGDTFTFYFGGVKKAVVSCHPEFIQHVLQKNNHNYYKSEIQVKRMGHFLGDGLTISDGEYWLTQRRLIQPGFHKKQLADLFEIMKAVLDELLDKFDKEIKEGPVNIHDTMVELTFRIIATSLFSTDLKEEALNVISNSITKIQEFIVRQIAQPYLNPWFEISGELKKHEDMRFRSDNIVLDYINSRQKEGGNYSDLLQMLLDARYEDTGKGMTDTQIITESMNLLIAGHETSSNAISWTWYLLSQQPETLKRIREEINAVVGDGPILTEHLPQLEYLNKVIEESMRLYPPFWMTDRVAVKDDKILGFDIPKGTTVILFLYGVHHSPKYWDQPEVFIPERFNKENKKKQTSFTYLPFGGGPRMCIGSNFAMMEMLLVFAKMLKDYDFELVSENVEPRPQMTLRPSDLNMRFTRLNA